MGFPFLQVCANLLSPFMPMKSLSLAASLCIVSASLVPCDSLAQTPVTRARDLNTLREFPSVTAVDAWQQRSRHIREQALVSCGLWPLPVKTELHPRVFGKVERDGYSVEKVAIETYPGVFLGGNLYRPLGKGTGPFPGVLNPHGHWANGRMANEETGSVAARCITFARLGVVAFSYDMQGYNDTFFPDHGTVSPERHYVRHRQFATNNTCQLWGISQMGLQTWNSVRALDFLAALPDVDPRRLGCTGESGGGTQTFMLGAIDNRLVAQAPIVMVSHSMQGGCSCENAPGLRVEYSNMEIAASAAPRPQMLVAATGDWTKDTLTVEGPALQGIYDLLGFPKQLRYVRFDFGHNYNQTSREAVYGWFNRWLLRKPSIDPIPEPKYQKEADQDLRVFPDDKLPDTAITEAAFITYLKQNAEEQFRTLVPKERRDIDRYSRTMLPAWTHSLQLADPPPVGNVERTTKDSYILRNPQDPLCDIHLKVQIPKGKSSRVVILAEAAGAVDELRQAMLEEGSTVVTVKQYSPVREGDPFANFFTTYNRTRVQQRVRDLVTVCGFARTELKAQKVLLCGTGRAGLWALLASPAADGVAADACQVDYSDDYGLLDTDLFYPGLKRAGGYQGAALLAAPNPLLLQNTGEKFPTDLILTGYGAAGAKKKVQVHKAPLPASQLAKWISKN